MYKGKPMKNKRKTMKNHGKTMKHQSKTMNIYYYVYYVYYVYYYYVYYVYYYYYQATYPLQLAPQTPLTLTPCLVVLRKNIKSRKIPWTLTLTPRSPVPQKLMVFGHFQNLWFFLFSWVFTFFNGFYMCFHAFPLFFFVFPKDLHVCQLFFFVLPKDLHVFLRFSLFFY